MDVLKIFVVEDDPFYGQILKHHLGLNPDYDVHLFDSGGGLMKNLYLQPDIVCIDFGLPDITGDNLLKQIKQHNAALPVIVISGQEEISIAVNLLKLGARDYIIKDDNTKENLWKSILYIRENLHLKREVETLKEELGKKYSFENTIIGTSEAIKSTFKLLQKAIDTSINVSITGETGTGKEVYAKAIHYNGPRKKKPFIAVNMGAIPNDLAESELFGHEKGAFTGAAGLKKGKFEEAHGGTLFLDEIGELDMNLQSKLLRVIQEREIVRVGGNQPIKIDIRLITATHKNMAEEVKKGNFREDLFFRIVGLPIELPPLRKRDNDVILLAKFFVEEFARNNNSKALKISSQAQIKLRKYLWPGNVRELKAIIDLACVMSEGNEIQAEDISFYELGESKVYSEAEKTLKEYENEIISYFLTKYDQNVLLVAEKLDIGKSKIYNLLKSGALTVN